ncbi:MAG: radical SAM protein [Bacilli bacterium]
MKKTLSLDCNSNIAKIEFDNFVAYYNLNNGKTVNILNKFINYKNSFFKENDFFEVKKDDCFYPKILICINITSNCNLRCKYCFNENKVSKKLEINQIKDFINYVVEVKNEAERYFVDMSGSGEPLLYLKDILEISKYCKEVSNKIGKELTVMLSTNGTLLSEEYTELLQKNNILFGVSLDGYKELHDINRVDINNLGTYDKVVNNIKLIRNNEYVGGGMTISNQNTDIFKAYFEMLSLFKTVSIRPARISYKDFDFSFIEDGYSKFVDYLISEIKNNNLQPLLSIINGDDYFGNIILKIMSNSILSRRCDAGIARFALGIDGAIFPCIPAVTHKELETTKAQIENNINNIYFSNPSTKCENCISRNICGSDCYVLQYEFKNESGLCEFKKYLFFLAMYLCGTIELEYFESYCKIIKIGEEIIKRNYYDIDLRNTFIKCNGKYKFTELKDLKDHNFDEYLKVKNSI